MRKLLICAAALATAAPVLTTPAAAQPYGYGGGHGHVRHEVRECRRELRHARNRWEYEREQRECQREIARARWQAHRDRDWHDGRRW